MNTNPPKYPLGTIAAYGPDDRLATKLVVAIFTHFGQKEPAELRRWFTTAGDARNDPAIAIEVADFLKKHGVKQTATYDRIIGCPHEEGVDYAPGGTCPRCPFWQNIDRYTQEPNAPSAPGLTPEQILAELSVVRDTHPVEALAAADLHREALIGPLLQAIMRGIEDPTGLPQNDATLFTYAIYLLAKWREPRGYPLIVRWLSLPGEEAFAIGGDTVTQEGSRFLASTCGGDLEPIKALILNRQANEYCRGQAVEALAFLAVWGEVPYESVVSYFLWLAREGLEREPSNAWENLAANCADIEALAVFPDLQSAYEEGLIDPMFMRPWELDEVETAPRGREIARFRERHPPISDVVRETNWWACFHREHASETQRPAEPAGYESRERPSPHRVSPKIGRNNPCPCGSGKKYKRCCGA
jgi:hypothetical protein